MADDQWRPRGVPPAEPVVVKSDVEDEFDIKGMLHWRNWIKKKYIRS